MIVIDVRFGLIYFFLFNGLFNVSYIMSNKMLFFDCSNCYWEYKFICICVVQCYYYLFFGDIIGLVCIYCWCIIECY